MSLFTIQQTNDLIRDFLKYRAQTMRKYVFNPEPKSPTNEIVGVVESEVGYRIHLQPTQYWQSISHWGMFLV